MGWKLLAQRRQSFSLIIVRTEKVLMHILILNANNCFMNFFSCAINVHYITLIYKPCFHGLIKVRYKMPY